LLTKAEAL
jgi:threonyl-tRNA synthetase